MKVRKFLSVLGSIALAAVGGVVLTAAPAQAVDANCKTATSTLTNRPDNGLNGVWGNESITRVLEICSTAEPAAGGPWTYKATVTDTGSFTTLSGSTLSPGVKPGVPLAGGVTGTVKGGYKVANFSGPADFSGFQLALLNGKTFDGAPDASQPSTTKPSTAWWVAVAVGSTKLLIDDDWEWIYTTCAGEKWTDNDATEKAGQLGNAALGGNITGLPCPAESTTPATQPADNDHLPVTGANSSAIAVTGAALLLAGVFFVVVARRRRHSQS